MFQQYKKIHRLGHEENQGILDGLCIIQEKIDGANTSIWLEDGKIQCGSRTRLLESGFNGFVDYANSHSGINALLEDHPNLRLYGEWLVRHTIAYKETSYKEFYLFDIMDDEGFYPQAWVQQKGAEYGIKTATIFAEIESPKLEDLELFVGKSMLGEHGEGIVIKNSSFVNKFGEKVYAKMVTQNFKESNAIVFGGNNKYSDTYWEMYIVNKYMTLPRVQKVMNKLQPIIDERLDMKHTARIAGSAYHDMITEEIWEIQKKVPSVDFKALNKLSTRKAVKIYHDILHGDISVAFNPIQNEDHNS